MNYYKELLPLLLFLLIFLSVAGKSGVREGPGAKLYMYYGSGTFIIDVYIEATRGKIRGKSTSCIIAAAYFLLKMIKFR